MQNKKKKILILTALSSFLFACGPNEFEKTSTNSISSLQSYKVVGKIIDQNDKPVVGCGIIFYNSDSSVNANTETDTNGEYHFPISKTGTYSMILIPPSDSYTYDGEKINFTYLSGKDLQMRDIILKKSNYIWGELS